MSNSPAYELGVVENPRSYSHFRTYSDADAQKPSDTLAEEVHSPGSPTFNRTFSTNPEEESLLGQEQRRGFFLWALLPGYISFLLTAGTVTGLVVWLFAVKIKVDRGCHHNESKPCQWYILTHIPISKILTLTTIVNAVQSNTSGFVMGVAAIWLARSWLQLSVARSENNLSVPEMASLVNLCTSGGRIWALADNASLLFQGPKPRNRSTIILQGLWIGLMLYIFTHASSLADVFVHYGMWDMDTIVGDAQNTPLIAEQTLWGRRLPSDCFDSGVNGGLGCAMQLCPNEAYHCLVDQSAADAVSANVSGTDRVHLVFDQLQDEQNHSLFRSMAVLLSAQALNASNYTADSVGISVQCVVQSDECNLALNTSSGVFQYDCPDWETSINDTLLNGGTNNMWFYDEEFSGQGGYCFRTLPFLGSIADSTHSNPVTGFVGSASVPRWGILLTCNLTIVVTLLNVTRTNTTASNQVLQAILTTPERRGADLAWGQAETQFMSKGGFVVGNSSVFADIWAYAFAFQALALTTSSHYDEIPIHEGRLLKSLQTTFVPILPLAIFVVASLFFWS
ncbi:hypothetical protein SAICODRAFT_126293 [Saitoella complicata NRRL Y-17804]|uniref:uncharacterized protein n=1 Tax=Saitoella complicata (strain BCRC 22490 / CBS 7301 / JCM 7358 / NBRC 10748 / NRRL Y-17804) TaxID=698492 RepID=UPI0008681B4A|nr:uncharacterized protein SAICODRAFT_126293 [Saitoella complicata NRRL Y-17804]ODQ52710.1 hypothetical protein SAICODRAFT_126293 [Saitoella complicata NRRL Y-17804]